MKEFDAASWAQTSNISTSPSTEPFDYNSLLSAEALLRALRPHVSNLMAYGYIAWYIIGIPANTLAFIVWMQRQMLNSSGCYMAALAITDIVFLIVHSLLNSGGEWFNITGLENFVVLCQALPTLYTAAQYMSALLVLEFTVEQFIAIRFPFKRSQYCRISIARKVIFGVSLFVIALSAPQAYFFVLLTYEDGTPVCTIRASLLEGDTRSFWTIWTWVTESIMFIMVPLSCLVLNILVVIQITKRSKITLNRHFINSDATMKGSIQKQQRHGATTVMLLAVSFYWVSTELPATVTLGLKQAIKYPQVFTIDEARANPTVGKYMGYSTARTTVEFLCFSRYSCKLLLYLVTGRQFRKHLAKILFKCNKKMQNFGESNEQVLHVVTRKTYVPESILPPSAAMDGRNSSADAQTTSLIGASL